MINGNTFTWSEFVWCSSIVMSRQNRIPFGESQSTFQMALIPVWDMCNHACLNEGKVSKAKKIILFFFSVFCYLAALYFSLTFPLASLNGPSHSLPPSVPSLPLPLSLFISCSFFQITTFYDMDQQATECLALANFKKGEQVCDVIVC